MASGFTTPNNQYLIRSNLYSTRLKELLLDDLFAYSKLVKVLTEFPDGTTFKIRGISNDENFAICWKPPKLLLLISENEEGKDSIKRGQSAGKKLNERNGFSLAGWNCGWRRMFTSFLSQRERRAA